MSFYNGIDVHKYNNKIDWQVAFDAGARFALVKAGGAAYNGSTYTDDFFERNSEIAPDFMPVGYWWVFNPIGDIKKQADYFIDLIKDKPQQIPAQIDVEIAPGISPGTFAARLLLFLEHLQAAYPDLKLIIYTRATFFNRYVARSEKWADYDLWCARYTTMAQPWGNPGDASYVYFEDWDSWVIWQWSADGNGMGTTFGAPPPPTGAYSMDLDRFNGTKDDFERYFNISQGLPSIVEVSAAKGTTLRIEPKGRHEVALPPMVRLAVTGEIKAADGSTWYNIGGLFVLADHVRKIE